MKSGSSSVDGRPPDGETTLLLSRPGEGRKDGVRVPGICQDAADSFSQSGKVDRSGVLSGPREGPLPQSA